MKKKVLAYWKKLLHLYFNDASLSEAWRERVRRLLVQDLLEEEKDAALQTFFDKMVNHDPHPDQEVGKKLAGIKGELGFPKDRLKGDSVQVELLIGPDARVPERAFESPTRGLSSFGSLMSRTCGCRSGDVGRKRKRAKHPFFCKIPHKLLTPIKTNFLS